MAELGKFDILEYLCKYLTDETGIPASTETPEVKQTPFITVIRTAGNRVMLRYDRPIITIWVWALSDAEAYDAMLRVRNAMADLIYTLEISSVTESSVRATNPEDSPLRRYEAVYFLLTTI